MNKLGWDPALAGVLDIADLGYAFGALPQACQLPAGILSRSNKRYSIWKENLKGLLSGQVAQETSSVPCSSGLVPTRRVKVLPRSSGYFSKFKAASSERSVDSGSRARSLRMSSCRASISAS